MVLEFSGCNWFFQRIICSTLSGKSISIKDIRINHDKSGISDYEVGLVALIEKISNGVKFHINEKGIPNFKTPKTDLITSIGTEIYYKPGILTGGKIEHNCGTERGIGYFMNVLIVLSPFCKNPVNATLYGITNHNNNLDLSVDMIRHVVIPNVRRFGFEEDLNFKVLKRSFFPNDSGKVIFYCPIIKKLSPIKLIDGGKIQKLRAVAYSSKVSGTVTKRLENKVRDNLGSFAKDIHVYRDTDEGGKGKECAPGYGLLLVGETTTGCLIATESIAKPKQIPEELVEKCCTDFLVQVSRRGCVDSFCQNMMFLYMALVFESVSTIRVGKLSSYSIEFLRHIKRFFGVVFRTEEEPESKTFIMTCLGVGLSNLSRKTF